MDTHLPVCSLSVNTGVILHSAAVWLPGSCQAARHLMGADCVLICLHSSLGHCTAPASVCVS